MKKLPLGIQNFREIITGDYVYVDKTQYIYNLIRGAKYYFLSRPRRFGKSLLLDTIGEVLKGEKELFKGLWIYDSDYEFKKYPVIRLDMSNISNSTPMVLEAALLDDLRIIIEDEELNIPGDNPSSVFKRLIRGLKMKYDQRIVILIDEYDKPILDHLNDIKTSEANRNVLRDFYGILKSMDPYICFTFITGVTKFTKTSIFSGLNNLFDITLAEDYANICGIPTESLNEYFGLHIENLSTHNNFKQYKSVSDEILAWYDGYSWDGRLRLLNPFSLLNFFELKKFESFWYSSGTPWFLIEMIKKKPESFLTLKNLEISEWILDAFNIQRIEAEPLLFQTGYLTVKDVIQTKGSPIYVLDIPNFEVRNAFNAQIVSVLTESGDVHTGRAQMEISRALESGDLKKMLDILRGLFASIPYNLHVDLEAYYHSIFYAVMTLLGFDMDVEVSVSKGRVDAVLELPDKVYIMEFKYSKCPHETNAEDKRRLFDTALKAAMDQINDRGYSAKYQGSGKAIYQAAFAFLGRDNIELLVENIKTT